MRASPLWQESTGACIGVEPRRCGYAVLPHYTAEYLEWGEGAPLVLLPGLAGGVGLMAPLAAALSQGFRVLSFQPRGEDDCFALRASFGLPDLVHDLSEFLDQLCLERPIVMGVSLGGVTALQFAARYPHRLSAVIAQGVDVRCEPTLVRRVTGQVLANYPLPSDSPFLNQFFNLFFGGRQNDAALVDFVTRQCWQTDQSVLTHRFRMAEQIDLGPELGRIQAPTLLLTGDRDLLVSAAGLHELREGIADARLVRLARAGHLAFITHAQEMADQTAAFARERQLIDGLVPATG